jgi:arylamine N-acetyltransferase
MFSIPLSETLIRRYLAILGVVQRECSLDALNELVAAHLMRIPFENLSSLYRFRKFGMKGIPDIETFLDGIEQYHFGGVCFASNVHFYSLLQGLGYDARPCEADIRTVNMHLVIVVSLENRDYLIDMGYGAPFSSAMPLDLPDDFVIALPRAEYRLKPRDPAGRSRMEFRQGGAMKGFYVVKPEPVLVEDFSRRITAAFRTDAPFQNLLLMARFWPSRCRVIHNLSVLDSSTEGMTIKTLSGRDDLVRCIEDSFEIPSPIVATAVDSVRALARV